MAQQYFYANLNEDHVCIGIAQTNGPVTSAKSVQVASMAADVLWRKHENGQWSEEKFIPGKVIMEKEAVDLLLLQIDQQAQTIAAQAQSIAAQDEAIDALVLDALTGGVA